MATELASQPTADLFAANQIGMGLKQLQPDVVPDVKQSSSLNTSDRSAGQSYDTQASGVTGLQVNAPGPAKVDNESKAAIAASAFNTGDSLSAMQGVKAEPPKGEIGYAGAKALQIGSELFKGIGDLFGSKNDAAPELDRPKPQVVFNTGAGSMPSPGGGMGG